MALFGQQQATAASSTTGDTSKDVDITQNVQSELKPQDSISDLMFSPTNDRLAVSSWDKNVYIYKVTANGAELAYKFSCPGHVLCVAWASVCISLITGLGTEHSP